MDISCIGAGSAVMKMDLFCGEKAPQGAREEGRNGWLGRVDMGNRDWSVHSYWRGKKSHPDHGLEFGG